MVDSLRGPESNGDHRMEVDEFQDRMWESLVLTKVRHLRSEGLEDEAIRRSVLDFAVERAAGITPFGFDSEDHRFKMISKIEQTLEVALTEPWPDDFSEPLRRITDRVEGESIRLADGASWTFPRLELEKSPRILADGSLDLQYPWIQDPDGVDLLTTLIWIGNGLSDPRTVLPHLLAAGTLLLRRNYSLTLLECHQLIPIDPENPDCLGELLALAPDEIPRQADAPPSTIAGPIALLTERIARELLTWLAPVIEDIRKVDIDD